MVVVDFCSLKFLTVLAIFLAVLTEMKLHIISFATVDTEEAFNGRCAIVVGASQGIGRALSVYLAQKGAKVVAVARQKSKLESLASEAEGYRGEVIPVAADAAAKNASDILLNVASKSLGSKLDYLFLNHANFYGKWDHFLDYEEETWNEGVENLYQVNVFSFLRLLRAFTPLLAASKGSVVATGSIAGLMGVPGHSAYSSSKAALHNLWKSLRIEYIIRGLDISISYAAVGNVLVEKRLGDDKDWIVKNWSFLIPSKERAARDLAHGAYRRVKEISTSVWEVGFLRAYLIFFSGIF